MNGPMMGTSIQDLQNQSLSQPASLTDDYANIRNLQDVQQMHQGHQMPMQGNPQLQQMQQMHQMQQLQQMQQMPSNIPNSTISPQDASDIEDLVRNINDNISEEDIIKTEDNAAEIKESDQSQSSSFLGIPGWLYEPLLLLAIYLLMSQAFVKDNIGKYIKQINPDADGQVSFVGVLIYGIILVVVFMVAKKYLL